MRLEATVIYGRYRNWASCLWSKAGSGLNKKWEGRVQLSKQLKQRPHVLYIMADQFHAECFGVAGRQVRTPHLDQLAGEGVLFEKAYCNNPVCAPSRASFITGQYPHTHGILGNDIHELNDRNEHTLSAVFRRTGYQTALIGKSHMVGAWDREGFEHLRYCDLCDCDRNDPLQNHYFKYLHDLGIANLYDLGTLKPEHPGSRVRAFESPIPEQHSLETWTGDETIAFLKNRDERRPFFAHMSFQRPHEPYTVPFDSGLLYDPDAIELPDSVSDLFASKFAGKPEIMRQLADTWGGIPYIPENEADLRRQLAFYYSLITRIDEQIGRVIDYLKQTGAYDNTIIIFTSDHGDFAGDHGIINKNIGIYESIHRIPFLLKYPGGPAGRKMAGIMESVDLFPTLCELCEVAAPAQIEGRSLMPVIEQGLPGKPFTACEWSFPKYSSTVNAIRTDRYRLVYYGQGEGELYDHASDPDELHNRFADSDYVAVRLQLLEQLFDHINRYRVKSSSTLSKAVSYRSRNTMTRLLHTGQRNWDEIKHLYR
ncbi:sulfatase-like hydrolase/transferase [Paenibacillus radicis (ex Xue et al. 2023)]|uniref:Sulfatase-like hydrolase/transferase n=1 Tax=Paenibacillus radicis (ex Xue et al. 2023) TaxID=2972489 RepID=A0ABT1YGD8_9BACL|nr:sulfatase-like hydrolase/transferase [Paenibacillus radicis (ex Xue et al. 2023)]MCR8632259.1 sulfatase-like hydrolase/transferase [Paenibacillus radicis (ex Xue et al. 2023)]